MANQREKRRRTRTGCLNCRRRRRKCDESKPTCLNCSKRGEICQRGLKLNFKKQNAQTIEDHAELEDDHPLECKTSPEKTKHFKIVDVTGNIIDRYNLDSPAQEPGPGNDASPGEIPPQVRSSPVQAKKSSRTQSVQPNRPKATASNQRRAAPPSDSDAMDGVTSVHNRGSYSANAGFRSGSSMSNTALELHQPDPTTNALTVLSPIDIELSNNNPTESAAQNLLFLRQVQRDPYQQATVSTPYAAVSFDISPAYSYNTDHVTTESFNDDGIFLPGSTYQELHATLRQHLIKETNSGVQSPDQSPPPRTFDTDFQSLRHTASSRVREQGSEADLYSGRTPPLELSNNEEYRLWKNWFDEVAGWLDKFDNHRHFQHTLPIMAQSCDHLKFSMLAVSARQIELKLGSRPTDQSLALYQQAIHLLLPQLHTRSTSVIASCVVLCVLEMLSCSPKAWRRHLDGCANLMQAVDITGFSGGIEQALFWCFARMDVCGGLIDSMKTLIPVERWASKIDIDADIGLFRASTSFDMYANHAVYLCAQAVVLLSEKHNRSSSWESKTIVDKWVKIWRYVQDWRARRPPEMLSVTTIAVSSLTPFPTILFSNPAAISGNQLYHTACILLLQNKPNPIRLDPKPDSVQWHARQICGISLSHDHHGAWTNSVQPLWIAGRCMSRKEEQDAILDHLHKIESESGWGTRWRMQDLQDYWDVEYG